MTDKITSNATPFWENGHYYSMSEEKKIGTLQGQPHKVQFLMD